MKTEDVILMVVGTAVVGVGGYLVWKKFGAATQSSPSFSSPPLKLNTPAAPSRATGTVTLLQKIMADVPVATPPAPAPPQATSQSPSAYNGEGIRLNTYGQNSRGTTAPNRMQMNGFYYN